MSAELDRLQLLLDRLHCLELWVPPPHERPIVEVARAALVDEVRELARRLHAFDHLNGRPRRAVPRAG